MGCCWQWNRLEEKGFVQATQPGSSGSAGSQIPVTLCENSYMAERRQKELWTLSKPKLVLDWTPFTSNKGLLVTRSWQGANLLINVTQFFSPIKTIKGGPFNQFLDSEILILPIPSNENWLHALFLFTKISFSLVFSSNRLGYHDDLPNTVFNSLHPRLRLEASEPRSLLNFLARSRRLAPISIQQKKM